LALAVELHGDAQGGAVFQGCRRVAKGDGGCRVPLNSRF
jgi:hypothetical protein